MIYALILFFSTYAFAKHVPPPDYDPSTTEVIREEVGDTVSDLADTIDAFFGEKRALDKYNSSTLILSQSQDVPEGGIPPTRTNISLNLRLFNFEQIGQEVGEAFLGIDREKDFHQNDPRKYPDVKKRIRAKSQRAIKKTPKVPDYPWRVTLDQQVIGNWPPGYLAKFRATKDLHFFGLLHHYQYEFGYDTNNIWSTRTSFVSDRQLHRLWLFRWANEVQWLLDRYVAGSSHGPSFIHTIGPNTFASYNARYNTTLFDRVLFVSSYTISATLRQDLYGGWVFGNIEPSLTLPRGQDYRRVWNLILRVEAIFGGG